MDTQNRTEIRDIYTIEEVKELIEPILNKYEIDIAYLFGSYAKGTATSESDIDLLIKSRAIKSLFKLGGLYYELSKRLNKKVDIVTEETFTNQPIDELDQEFYEEILKDRRLVYER